MRGAGFVRMKAGDREPAFIACGRIEDQGVRNQLRAVAAVRAATWQGTRFSAWAVLSNCPPRPWCVRKTSYPVESFALSPFLSYVCWPVCFVRGRVRVSPRTRPCAILALRRPDKTDFREKSVDVSAGSVGDSREQN